MKRRNSTMKDIERQVQEKLAKMYKSMPNAEMEYKIERDLATRLGGDLAKAFFK